MIDLFVARERLIRAAEFFEKRPDLHCKGNYFEGDKCCAAGQFVDMDLDPQVSRVIQGVIAKELGIDRHSDWGALIRFNDRPETTPADVAKLFRGAANRILLYPSAP